MAYWLMKSEPDVFSYADMAKNKPEEWHGVRNYAARNNMKAMKLGDEGFFYHSNIGKSVMGIMKVVAGRTRIPPPSPTTRARSSGSASTWLQSRRCPSR